MNPYYTAGNVPTYRAFGASSVQRGEFAAIQAGFDAVELAIFNATIGDFPNASEGERGSVFLATTAEALAGTDTTKAVTPAGLAAGKAGFVNVGASSTNANFQVTFNNGNAILSNTGLTFNPSTGVLNSIAFNSTSLRSAKDDIKPYDGDALEIIRKTQICTYTFKEDAQKTKRVGFIADDTHKLMAGINHDHCDINNTVGLLLKAVQQLSDEVSHLTALVSP